MHENWEVAYRAAMLETDEKQLAVKLPAAVLALRSRLSELNSLNDHIAERERIQSALRTLDTIRRLELRAST